MASNFPVNQNDRVAALLRSSLGTEGYRILMSLTKREKTSYDDTVATLKAHFDRHSMAIFERAKFARSYQHLGESVTEFVTCLKELANKCNFEADHLDIRVRDQFVPHLTSDKIRELLYQEPDTLTLDNAFQKAVALERVIAEATPAQGKAFRVTGAQGKALLLSSWSSLLIHGVRQQKQLSSEHPRKVCFACGKSDHFVGSPSCLS